MRIRRMVILGCCAVMALALAGCGGGGASMPTTGDGSTPSAGNSDTAFGDTTVYASGPGASLATANETAAITHHQITLGGKAVAYTAKAGHLTAADAKTGTPKASFFYVAYTADGLPAATRPITFFYNGGPGSASMWLHLGSFGPKRLVTGDPSTTPVKPFPLVDNADSLLDTTDMVFVDAIGTGYSEAIAPYNNGSFWGVDADANAFRDFVMRYLAVNQRGGSPIFLFGESYGTLRSAVLAEALESAGVNLTGVVLQSSILNYNSNCGVFNPGQVSCTGYLPSYAAIGAYYGLTNPAQTDIPAYMQQMRTYAAGSYGPAVDAYLPPSRQAPPAGMINQLVDYTGARLSLWQANFDLDPTVFQQSLVSGQLIGRYDARVSAINGSPLAAEGDPSSTVIDDDFYSTLKSYLPQVLQYSSASSYTASSNAIYYWDFSHDGQDVPDSVPDLAAAFALNPKLRVLSLNGYHDLATPFYQTEIDLARLGAAGHIVVRQYNGGHMTYLDDGSRPKEKADLVAFYSGTLVQRQGE